MMRIDTDDTHTGWEAQKGMKPQKQYGATNPLKQMIDLLGVTMEELRNGGRERRLADARTLLAAALPISQEQMAELLNCSRQAVGKMRHRHNGLLMSDAAYRTKWNSITSTNNNTDNEDI